MKRRDILKGLGLAAGAIALGDVKAGAAVMEAPKKRKLLKIAHITDVHIQPDAVPRFNKCLEMIKRDGVDFILNGGDSIMAADYNDITKDRVVKLWESWHKSMELVKDIPLYSVLGNHDMWWMGKDDELGGKQGALKMLGLKNNYYSFDQKGWHFIMLDSNHATSPGMLDDAQWNWFVDDVTRNAADKPTLIMSHYPLLSCTGLVDNKDDFMGPFKVSGGYNHLDLMKFIALFNKNKNIKVCLSGHIHLLDKVVYNDVSYLCNGATSGYWWGAGDDGKGSYKQTVPGYSLLNLYSDGSFDHEYIKYEQ